MTPEEVISAANAMNENGDYEIPDQMTALPTAVDTTFAADGNPMAVVIRVSFHRAPRQKCVVCGKRRVGFWIGLGDVIARPILCAKCAGIR